MIWILYICAALLLLVICDIAYRFIRFQRQALPLEIKCFSPYDEPFHPCVLYFKEGFGGYKYWMAETPLPKVGIPYSERWECPTIHVSNNGVDWLPGVEDSFPLADLTPDEIEAKCYYSDPHLVYAKDKLECWYRFCRMDGSTIVETKFLRRITSDGIVWSQPELLCQWYHQYDEDNIKHSATELLFDNVRAGDIDRQLVLSPSVEYDGALYHMWYCVQDNAGQLHVAYSTSSDAQHWEDRNICELQGGSHLRPWHLSVLTYEDSFYLTLYDAKVRDVSLWEGKDPMHFQFSKCLLSTKKVLGCPYSRRLYRSSLVHDGEWKLYYSAESHNKASIGLMHGRDLMNLKQSRINHRFELKKFWQEYCSYLNFKKKRLAPKFAKIFKIRKK